MTAALPVFLDNTVLVNFALAECTELVTQLWGTDLQTTPDVMAEYREGVAQGTVPSGAWDSLAIIELKPEDEDLRKELPSSLGSGESSCLAMAFRHGGTVATDDSVARKAAAVKGVNVTGTVGILIGCIKKGLIDLSEGNRLLTVMIEHSYHSPTIRLSDFL